MCAGSRLMSETGTLVSQCAVVRVNNEDREQVKKGNMTWIETENEEKNSNTQQQPATKSTWKWQTAYDVRIQIMIIDKTQDNH